VVFADAVGDERAIQLLRDPSIGCEVPEELFAGEPLGGGFVSCMGAVTAPAIVLRALDDASVDGIERDVPDDVEQLGFFLHHSSLEAALEEVPERGHASC
jgi:hypothetical protein